MARMDRSKRAFKTAVIRDKASKGAVILNELKLIKGRVLDYGCGYGYDAELYGWDSYDPFYKPGKPEGIYDTIICNLVLNVLSKNKRNEVIDNIKELLSNNGHAYLIVPRNIPKTGKLGIHHSLQNYVVYTLPSIYSDKYLEIYDMEKNSIFKDKTVDHISNRDKRREA